jgi:hypothetical protein
LIARTHRSHPWAPGSNPQCGWGHITRTPRANSGWRITLFIMPGVTARKRILAECEPAREFGSVRTLPRLCSRVMQHADTVASPPHDPAVRCPVRRQQDQTQHLGGEGRSNCAAGTRGGGVRRGCALRAGQRAR